MPRRYDDDNFDIDYIAADREEVRALERAEAQAEQQELDSLVERRINQRQAEQDAGEEAEDQQSDEEREFFGGLGELGEQVLGGVRDAGVNVAQTVLDFGGLVESGVNLDQIVPDVGEPTSTVGGFARTTTQFLTAFVPALGALKAVKGLGIVAKGLKSARATRIGRMVTQGYGGEVARASLAGAAADFAVFDPQEARFANLLKDWGVDNEVVNWLAADAEDGAFEGRAKNVLEGAGLGVVADSIILAFRAARRVRLASQRAASTTPSETVAAAKETTDRVVVETTRLDMIARAQDSLEDVRALPSDAAADEARGVVRTLLENPELDQAAVRNQLSDEARVLFDGAEARAGASGRALDEELEDLVRPMEAAQNVDHPMGPRVEETNPGLPRAINRTVKDGRAGLEGERASAEDALGRAVIDADEVMRSPTMTEELRTDLLGTLAEAERLMHPKAAAALESARSGLDPLPPAPARLAIPAEDSVTTRGSTDDQLVQAADRSVGHPPQRVAKGYVNTSNPTLMRSVNEAIRRGDPYTAGRVIAQDNTNFDRIVSEGDFNNMQAEIANVLLEARGTTTARGRAAQVPKSAKARGAVGRSLAETESRALEIAQREADQIMYPGGGEQLLANARRVFQRSQEADIEMTALRMMRGAFMEDLGRLATKAIHEPQLMTDLEKVQLHHRRELYTQLDDIVSGAGTNFGRNLRAMGIIVNNGGVNLPAGAIPDFLSRQGGDAALQRDAMQILAGITQGPGALRSITKRQLLHRMVVEFWLGSILSGPITQTVNIVSNTITSLWRTGENLVHGFVHQNDAITQAALREYMSLGVGLKAALRMNSAARQGFGRAMREAFTGDTDAARRTLADVGANENVGAAWRAFALDEPQTVADARQFELGKDAFTSGNVMKLWESGLAGPLAAGTPGAKFVNMVGNVIRMPGRLLTTGDELAKSINYHMRLASLAYDDAIRKEITDVDNHIARMQQRVPGWEDSIDELTAAEERDFSRMDRLAKDDARIRTWTDPLAEGSVGKDIQSFVMRHPTARFIIPFVRTPINLLKFTFERTPVFHRMTNEYKEAIRQAEAGAPAALSAHRTRLTMGYMMYVGAGLAAYEGKITSGGPSQPDERAALLATGWQPYSVRFQDEDGSFNYVSFNRTDPYGLFLGIAADLGDTFGMMEVREAEELAVMASMAVAKNLTSKSYFTGITGLVDAINRPDQRMETFLERFGASFVPNLFAQTTRTGISPTERTLIGTEKDDVLHEVNSVLQAMRARIPGLSADLPPRRNVFGEVIIMPMGLGPDTISPFFERKQVNSLVNREYARLVREQGFGVQMRGLYGQVHGVELSAEQRDRYIVLSSKDLTRNGNTLRTEMTKLMESRRYQRAGDGPDGKQALIRSVMSKHRTRAKRKLLREFPELALAVKQARRARRLDRTGRGGGLIDALGI